MLLMLGLDHRRASVEARGRLSFTGEALTDALVTLRGRHEVSEAAILSTCNRTELYLATRRPETVAAEALQFLHDAATRAERIASPVSPAATREAIRLEEAIYTAYGLDVVDHLYHVAAGLRSMVIGEAQILGQVREALSIAETQRTAGEELRAAFTGAIQAGKRVRAETGISRADASVAGLAVHAARAELGDLADKTITLVGAGRTNQLSAQLLSQEGIRRLLIANRHVESARTLAEQSGGTSLALDDLGDAISQSDALICATAAPYPVISGSVIAPRDASHPLLIIDLAVPADVTSDVGALPGVRLLTLDTLRELPSSSMDDPAIASALLGHQADIEDAERIIARMLREYTKAQTVRLAAPGIAALRQHVDRSEEQELARALAQLEHLSARDRAIVERFGARLVDKMFHHLVRRIRTLAEYDEIPPETTMRVLAQLFADPQANEPDTPSHD
jgi:glutamyl-tRNA reductase